MEIANYSTRFQPRNGNLNSRGGGRFSRKDGNRKCTHYNSTNHTRERCFELIGYLEWFPEERQRHRENQAHAVDEGIGQRMTDESGDKQAERELTQQQLCFIAQEMARMMKGKQVAESPLFNITNSANVNSNEDFSIFAGISGMPEYTNVTSNMEWIIDSGATSHMSSQIGCFENVETIKYNYVVILLDRTKQKIEHIGIVKFSERIHLRNVLHLRNFQFNLLSVERLLDDIQITV